MSDEWIARVSKPLTRVVVASMDSAAFEVESTEDDGFPF
jgi:hypothetical protein